MDNVTIMIPIDLSAGSTATNYTPPSNVCPILSLFCATSSAGGTLKFTPLRATDHVLGGSGTGGRLRFTTDQNGALSTVEIANAGSGYTNGPISVTLVDPFGTGGYVTATASGGSITAASIGASGSNYSGYITFSSTSFTQGKTYDMIPRYLELTGGSSTNLVFIGLKYSFRPFQVF